MFCHCLSSNISTPGSANQSIKMRKMYLKNSRYVWIYKTPCGKEANNAKYFEHCFAYNIYLSTITSRMHHKLQCLMCSYFVKTVRFNPYLFSVCSGKSKAVINPQGNETVFIDAELGLMIDHCEKIYYRKQTVTAIVENVCYKPCISVNLRIYCFNMLSY